MASARSSILPNMYPFTLSPQFAQPVASVHTTTKHETANSERPGHNDRLTHLTRSGSAHMVHILPPSNPVSPRLDASTQTKPPTARVAIARSVIVFSNPAPLALIQSAGLKKGDALSVARIAGIMAAKQTATLIPLCHNIPLSGVNVEVQPVEAGAKAPPFIPPQKSNEGKLEACSGEEEQATWEPVTEFGGVVVTARIHTYGQTGVEMEALTAATLAGLTIYDMCKASDKYMRMEAVRVCLKEGGKSGRWVEKRRDG